MNKIKITLLLKLDILISFYQKITDTNTSDLEAEIDKLVYELYGLSEEEIKVVEGK